MASLSFAATAAIIIIAVVATDNRNRHNVLALSLSSPQAAIRIGGIDRYRTRASSSRYSSSSDELPAEEKSRRRRSGRRMHGRTFGPRRCDSMKLNPRSSSSSGLWQTNNEDDADESGVATMIATSTVIFDPDLEGERSMEEQRSDTTRRQLASSLSTNVDMSKRRSNDDDDYNNDNNDGNKERTIAILVLLTVPISWGTYTPVVKYMYDKITPSMPGFIFSTGYYIVAALTLRGILLVVGLLSSRNNNNKLLLLDNNNVIEQEKAGGNNNNNNNINNDLITKRGGLELGSYLFIGNGLQVIGLQSVPADRAAFLVQLTTVMVPLLSAITAGTIYAIPLRTYVACCIAFIGVVVMGADGSSGGSGGDDVSNYIMVDSSNDGETITTAIQSMQIVSQGDILCILAALAYTMHVVRLGKYAPQTNPLELAAAKATTEALLGIILCSCLAYVGSSSDLSQLLGLPTFVNQMGSSISEYFSFLTTELTANNGAGLSNEISSSLVISIGAILWTGWVTCAYTIYAQSYGQRIVGPADSNLIYTTQPLFSSLFAYLLLGETLGSYGYVGATLIGISLWLVSSSKQKEA